MSHSYKKSEATASRVKALAVRGYKSKQIAKRLELDLVDLETHYGRELDVAGAEMRVLAAATMFKAATQQGDLASIAQILKTRAGWSERAYLKESAPLPEIEPVPTFADLGRNDWWMPCNARQGCPKAGPKERLNGLMRLWEQAVESSRAAGCDVQDLLKNSARDAGGGGSARRPEDEFNPRIRPQGTNW